MSVCLGIGCGTLCRSGSCMLRCWLWDAVPIWFLYASVLDAGCCADLFFWGYGRLLYWLWIVLKPFSVCFGVSCGMLCRSGSCMLRYWMRNTVPIWFLYASVLDVERCADLFLYIVFFGHWAECTFASIVCSLRLNFQPGMWQRYGLLWRRCDTA